MYHMVDCMEFITSVDQWCYRQGLAAHPDPVAGRSDEPCGADEWDDFLCLLSSAEAAASNHI